MFSLSNTKIGVIGLGYVGLPLALEFSKRYPVVGFDVSNDRISALKAHNDSTCEVTSEELAAASHLSLSNDKSSLMDCNVYIVTVPTPIDAYKRPDLSPLVTASKMIGSVVQGVM